MHITATRRHMLERVRQVGRGYYRAIRPAIVARSRDAFTIDPASPGWTAASDVRRRWRENRPPTASPPARQHLGDHIKAAIEALGIRQTPGCGCAERQQAINSLHAAFRALVRQIREILTTPPPTAG